MSALKISFFVILSLLATSSWASGAIETKEMILKDETTPVELVLDTTTVRCSAVGYGVEELKVSVPYLQYLAFFNHANRGETLPCISAGACEYKVGEKVISPGFSVDSLVDPSQPTAKADLHVVLKETYSLDHDQKKCTRVLEENVDTEIRGIKFRHYRSGALGDYPYELCKLVAPAS